MKIRPLLVLLLILLLVACSSSNTPTPTADLPFPEVNQPDIVLFYMLDASNGWATTATQVLRTVDGGQAWFDVTPAGLDMIDFVPFYALNEEIFWLLIPDYTRENASRLYRTTDGGGTWDSFDVPLGTALLQFLDAATGFAMSDLGMGAGSQAISILKTLDGGETWELLFTHQGGLEQDLPFNGEKYGMTYLDASRAWVGGRVVMQGYIYFYRSLDGGLTWEYQDIPLPDAYAQVFTGANPPIFFSPTQGILPLDLYGSSYSRIFYHTTDGGETWTPGERVISLGLYSPVSFETIFLWTGSPKLYISNDSGQTWQTIDTNVDISTSLVGMQFVDEQNGWALTSPDGLQTSLYRTMDGGHTWNIIIP